MSWFGRFGWLLMLAPGMVLAPERLVGQAGDACATDGRFSVELTPTIAIPVGAFAARAPGLGARSGLGLALGAAAEIHRGVGLYGGVRYTRFRCSECPHFGLRSAMNDFGFEGGGELRFADRGIDPWVRAGLLGHQLQLLDENADRAASRIGWGFGLGLGADHRIWRDAFLSPSVGFRSYQAVFPLASFADQGTAVRYAAATLGLRYRF
jgi:hypothetical protein